MASNVERFYRKALRKYLPLEDFDSDEDFKVSASTTCKRGKLEQGKFRPKRAASSRAMEHLHNAFDEDLFVSRYICGNTITLLFPCHGCTSCSNLQNLDPN